MSTPPFAQHSTAPPLITLTPAGCAARLQGYCSTDFGAESNLPLKPNQCEILLDTPLLAPGADTTAPTELILQNIHAVAVKGFSPTRNVIKLQSGRLWLSNVTISAQGQEFKKYGGAIAVQGLKSEATQDSKPQAQLSASGLRCCCNVVGAQDE